MFLDTRSGRNFPPDSLREQKDAAWALMAGMSAARPTRAHRATLPDVYPAAAAPRKPNSFARRLAERLREVIHVAAGKRAAVILLSGTSLAGVGKTPEASYIDPEEIVS